MDVQIDMLSFLDLLDLDEDIIDQRLKSLALRSNYTNKHLQNMLLLLQYKHLINIREESDWDNNIEYDLAVKLVSYANNENVEYICKIIHIALLLDKTSIINKSEHLIQQIFVDMDLRDEDGCCSQGLINLKLCGSVLDAVLKSNNKLYLHFLETSLENLLYNTDEKFKAYFLNNTVPMFFAGVIGYNILDKIWACIQHSEERLMSLQILSCLSDYYLPLPDAKGNVHYKSEIMLLYEFWDNILSGIMSNDLTTRKTSVYLSKRAIDCIVNLNKDVCVQSETDIIFFWNTNNSEKLKSMWDDFFILIDSLEEKQSNIVLPSLKLFETIDIGENWMNAAFNIGLGHDNTQVRLKCTRYKLKTKIRNHAEALILLEVFNDIYIYDIHNNYNLLKTELGNLLKEPNSFLPIINAIPSIKWSPIPFYHISDVLANLKITLTHDIYNTFMDILKLPCNNIIIRKSARLNLASFIRNYCGNLNWRDTANIYSVIQLEPQRLPLVLDTLNKVDKYHCFKSLSNNTTNIDLILFYLSNNNEELSLFLEVLDEKITNLNNTVTRQYCDKQDCLNDVIFLMHLLSKTKNYNNSIEISIHETVVRQNRLIIQYILSLFSNENNLNIKHASELLEKHDNKFESMNLDDLLHLYKVSTVFLKDKPILGKAVLSLFTIKMLHNNTILINNFKHEMLNLVQFLDIISNYQFEESQTESVGRLKNIFYEKTSEIIYQFIDNEKKSPLCINQIMTYVKNTLECGGYGCLKWLLKIVNKIAKPLVDDMTGFDVMQFINRVGYEIEALKSNSQYSPCMEQLIELITQEAILSKTIYNNLIVSYCKNIVENGSGKTNPIYYLIRNISKQASHEYRHVVYILCEMLLYCPVLRKDQRITDNLCLQILQDEAYGIDKNGLDIHFNFEIQYLLASTLCKITDPAILNRIAEFITDRIDTTFRNKQRYHGNSQQHKTLLTSLQHILIIVLKSPTVLDQLSNWCLDLLVKLPHQPSVRICFEWFVALYYYIQKIEINEDTVQILKSRNVPLTSQFFILYWLLKHKITNNNYTQNEYNYVLDFLLLHTMGQLFNIRLHAQYLAVNLHKMVRKSNKYDYTISLIENTFKDCCTDKNYFKLKTDYFVNKFDIVANLNPYFIYYLLPKYCDIDIIENIDLDFVRSILKCDISIGGSEEFIVEWKSCQRDDEEFVEQRGDAVGDSKSSEEAESMGTIQKKYVPWKNMSDVNVFGVEKKTEPQGNLILVASLIDKLPNLGGMARTSEVFGVNTYVVGSVRNLQDKQFQGLSVSAERWINIEEVRPGHALKEYLLLKKTEGYSVVAAEQTSTSCKLQSFKFPRKTILLLGQEKEGVPCDLLPLMDHCVEIPQQGYVRSLNVHVTAAIFVWEYVKQNVLEK